MRLDDKDEVLRGMYKYWYVCDLCRFGCTVDEYSGKIEWDDPSMPF